MVIQKLTQAGRVGTITFELGAAVERPYQVTIQQKAKRPEQLSFAVYEEALAWAAQKMEMPFLINPPPTPRPDVTLRLDNFLRERKLASLTVCLATDGTGLATIQGNGSLRYYDRQRGEWTQSVQIEGPVDRMAIAPNATLGVVARKRLLEVWHLPTGTLQRTIALPFAPHRLTVWPDNETMVLENSFEFHFLETYFPFVQFWNLLSGSLIGDIQLPVAQRDSILLPAVFSEQKDRAALSQIYESGMAWDRVRLSIFSRTATGQFEMLANLAVQPAKSQGESGSFGSFLKEAGKRLAQAFSGDILYDLRYEDLHWAGAVFTHDNQQLFVGITHHNNSYYKHNSTRPVGHYIHRWQYAEQQGVFRPTTWMAGHSNRVLWLLVTPHDDWLISGSMDGTVRLWSVETGELQRTLDGHKSAVRCGVLNSDGTMLATGDEQGQIIVWSVPDGQLLIKMNGHEKAITYLALPANGRTLISVCETGRMIEWALAATSAQPKLLDERNIHMPQLPD